jgi:hypothetical protein
VKVINRLANKYREEEVATALMKHWSRRERDIAAFVGTWLTDIWEINRKAESETEPHCCECGANILDNVKYDDKDARADARYCSPKCRQRAYRKRYSSSSRPTSDVSHRNASRDVRAPQP